MHAACVVQLDYSYLRVQLGYSYLRAKIQLPTSAARLHLPTSMYRAGSKAGGSKFIGPISYDSLFNSIRRWLLILHREPHIVAATVVALCGGAKAARQRACNIIKKRKKEVKGNKDFKRYKAQQVALPHSSHGFSFPRRLLSSRSLPRAPPPMAAPPLNPPTQRLIHEGKQQNRTRRASGARSGVSSRWIGPFPSLPIALGFGENLGESEFSLPYADQLSMMEFGLKIQWINREE